MGELCVEQVWLSTSSSWSVYENCIFGRRMTVNWENWMDGRSASFAIYCCRTIFVCGSGMGARYLFVVEGPIGPFSF